MSPVRRRAPRRSAAGGFSLVEIAIVLAILGLLTRAVLVPLGSLRETRREHEARSLVETAREALIASAVAHGTLPCPVPATGTDPIVGRRGNGAVSRVGDRGARVACPSRRGGLPAVALALPGPIDAAGAALDPWGRALTYALSPDEAAGGTTASRAGDGSDAGGGALVACRVAGRGPCPAREVRAADLAFVVLSHGADPSATGLQGGNASGRGDTFTLAPRSTVPAHRFDDLLAWGSRAELAWWRLRAGHPPATGFAARMPGDPSR